MYKNYSMIVLLILVVIVSTGGTPATVTTSLPTELIVGDTWTYKRSNSSMAITATVVDAFTDEFGQKIIKVIDNSSEVIGPTGLFGWENETFSFKIVKFENLTKYASAWGNFPIYEEGIMTVNITLLPNITLEMPLTKTPMTLWSFYGYSNQYSYDPYLDAMEGEVGNIQRVRYVLDYNNEIESSTTVKRLNIIYDELIYPTNLFHYTWMGETYLARSAIQTYHGIDFDISFIVDGVSYSVHKHFNSYELIYNNTKYTQLYDADVPVPVQIYRWGLHGSGTSTEYSLDGYVTTVDTLIDVQLMERRTATTNRVTFVTTVSDTITTTIEATTNTAAFGLVTIIGCVLLSLLLKKALRRIKYE